MKNKPLYKTGNDLIVLGKLLRRLTLADVDRAQHEIEKAIPGLHAIADMLRDELEAFRKEN